MPEHGPRVGAYRLLAQIGEGGMGVVHLAQAPDGRRVALKVLRPHIIGDEEARERLAREVSSLRLVRSPRVAEVLDADPWGETPYVATRYVPGLSLYEHVRQEGPLDTDDLRWFGRCLAEAVAAVHRVGVLHRDIKPSNVLLEGRSPVLIDFGLARLAEDPRMTHTGWLLGTPGYLAPEILYGEDASPASDVHAWGATVAFAGTGNPPFGRGPAMAIMDRVRRGEHDLSGIHGDLRALVRECLAPMAHDRPTLDEVDARLGGTAQPSMPMTQVPSGQGDLWTVPVAVAGLPDHQRTEVVQAPGDPVGPARPVGLGAPASDAATVVTPHHLVATPGTRAYTVVAPQPAQPGAPASVTPPQTPSQGQARLQRGLLAAATFVLVAVTVARAPYLGTLAVSVAVLLVRAWSWTAESVRYRRSVRGPRWHDGPATAVLAPWYLLVATGGTFLLMAWAVGVAMLAAVLILVFAVPVVPGMLGIGAIFAAALWWGPGSRRLTRQGQVMLRAASAEPWLGWSLLAVVGVAIVLLGHGLSASGILWDPLPGAPWRSGTFLAELRHWI